MAGPQLCAYFKYGHWKYMSNCRNRHVQDVCDIDKCDGKSCEKRRPKSLVVIFKPLVGVNTIPVHTAMWIA